MALGADASIALADVGPRESCHCAGTSRPMRVLRTSALTSAAPVHANAYAASASVRRVFSRSQLSRPSFSSRSNNNNHCLFAYINPRTTARIKFSSTRPAAWILCTRIRWSPRTKENLPLGAQDPRHVRSFREQWALGRINLDLVSILEILLSVLVIFSWLLLDFVLACGTVILRSDHCGSCLISGNSFIRKVTSSGIYYDGYSCLGREEWVLS